MDAERLAACREHYRTGTTSCLVCDDPRLYGGWTDFNGQIRCSRCGVTYQILTCKLSAEWLAELGLTAGEVKVPYCDVFDTIDVYRDYWTETKAGLPLGSYFGGTPKHVADLAGPFYRWLATNADRYRELHADDFDWDRLLKRFPQPVGG